VLNIDVLEAVVKALRTPDDGQYLTVIKRRCHFECLHKTLSFVGDPER
jgi:hypothetical protein